MSGGKAQGDDAPLKWQTRDHVAILTLNRPQALNAFDLELMEAHGGRIDDSTVRDLIRSVWQGLAPGTVRPRGGRDSE